MYLEQFDPLFYDIVGYIIKIKNYDKYIHIMNKIMKFHPSSVNSMKLSGGGGMINKVLPTNPTYRIILFVVCFVFVIVGSYLLYRFFSNKSSVSYKENTSSNSNGANGNEVELLRFSTSWCPHCKSSKPDWEKLETEYKGKTVNGYKIIFTEVDCTQESPEVEKMMNRYKVEGFPTTKLVKDNKVYDFEAKPTKENLDKFINTVVV